MDLNAVNKRVDIALKANRRAEFIVVAMALCIFALGAGVILVAYWYKNPYVGGSAFAFQSFLYLPIRQILKLRKDNLILQTMPVFVAEFPPEEYQKEIKKLLAYLRDR